MVAILLALAAVIAVVTAWGFYPIGVIVLLAVALVGALWGALRRGDRGAGTDGQEPDAAARRHDARIVAEVRGLVTRSNIENLRGWDFGASWQASWVHPLYDFVHLDDVEHKPIDPELAAALRRLFDANREFTHVLAVNSWPQDGGGGDWYNIGWSGGAAEGLGGDAARLFEHRRGLLNAGVDPLIEAYDGFVEVARRKLLLEAAEADG